jgi:hypothetical protein
VYFKNSEILQPLKSWFLISPRAILYTKMGPIFKGFGFDLKILNQNGYQLTQNGFVHIYIYAHIYIYIYSYIHIIINIHILYICYVAYINLIGHPPPPLWKSCSPVSTVGHIFPTLPADISPHLSDKQDGMLANFEIYV